MSDEERGLLSQVSLLLPLVSTSLKLAGFQRTYRWLYRPVEVNSSDASDALVRQASDTVALAARNLPVYRATCLSRSLVLWHLLRKHGRPADLRIGVQVGEGGFNAHAWVEQEGTVVNDRADIAQEFTPIDFSSSFAQGR